MRLPKIYAVARLALLLSLAAPASWVFAQQKQPEGKDSGQDPDIVRINTELVQTDVMVFDKRGRFVDGLRPEQFELNVDGKPRPLSFFEQVATGSAAEAAQLKAALKARASTGVRQGEVAAAAPAASSVRGRVIIFFLDDMHLGDASLARARKGLIDFVENRMAAEDQVAIVSTSGRIGFLQQLTDNRTVLETAISRLNAGRLDTENNSGKTHITAYEADRVVEHNDRDLFNYLLSSVTNEFQLVAPKGGDERGLAQIAANVVKNRTRQIEAESKASAVNTLAVLESLMQSSSQLPGRKLVFFISDGFITGTHNSNAIALLKRVTENAARVGVVVYSMDARGTYNDPGVDAGRNDFPDGMASGTSARLPSLEAAAMQEPLNILAEDTGGRAIIGNNSFADAFRQAIDETSTYYLLAWRPEGEGRGGEKARIKVSVKDRPDLRVRLRRNYYVAPPSSSARSSDSESEKNGTTAPPPQQTVEAGLLLALGSLYPRRDIPTAISAGYINTPDQGLVLKTSMQVERAALATESGKTELDVLGAAVDDRGIIVTFKQVVTVGPDPSGQNSTQPVVWSQQLKLRPGLYQVRVAVRERASGRTGSAHQWIEVPDLSGGRFQLSSLFLGERKSGGEGSPPAAGPRAVAVDVDHRFSRSSVLRFQTYVYNAPRAGGGTSPPDVEMIARILRDGRPVSTAAPAKLPADTTKDIARLPYWSELDLGQLPPGRYTLLVTATDRSTRGSATQQTNFIVE